MTQETSRLVLAVDSSQVRSAKGDLDSMGRAGDNAADKAGGVTSAFRALGTVLAAVSLAQVARDVIRQADAYSNLNARLKLVTFSTSQFAAAQTALFGIAQRTGTSLEATSDLFGSLARSTEALGVSQERVLGVTRTINEALTVSGASAAGAAAALVQLGQGFASGALRGEELNSVLEQAPRLAKAIADGLGVTVGQLRQLGQDGKLTADRVFGALEKSGASITQEFETLPTTVGRAVTQASNALLKLIGSFDDTTGATRTLAAAISGPLVDAINKTAQAYEGMRRINPASLFGKELQSEVASLRLTLARVKVEDLTIGLQKDPANTGLSQALKAARADYDELQRAATRANETLKQTLSTAAQTGDFSNEGRNAARPVAAVRPEVKTTVKSEAQRYLESLQQQLQGTRDMTAAETVLADIQSGRLGKLTKAQSENLLGIAREIDSTKAAIDAARERSDLRKEENEQILAFTRAQEEANRARLQSIVDATPTGQLRSVLNEIEFINQAFQNGEKDTQVWAEAIRNATARIKQGATEDLTKISTFAEQAGRNIQDALGSTLESVLSGSFDNIGQLWRNLITRMAAEAAAAQLNQFLFGNTFGGGGSGAGVIGNFVSSFLSGRAIGGPVSAGGVYRVNERGPELLNVGSQQYLMMGSQGGSVTPNAATGGTTQVIINNTINGDVSPGTVKLVENAMGRVKADILRSSRTGGAYAGAY